MNRNISSSILMIGLLGMLWLHPQAARDVYGAIVVGNTTITIMDPATGNEIPDWLPEPGRTVRIVTNPPVAVSFVSTTNHRGICTNFGDSADVGPDFVLSGNDLTSNDCGGTVTISVDRQITKLPQDANNNNIADLWENARGGNLGANQDIDLSPATTDASQPTGDPTCVGDCRKGDGISTFDEYRGFVVSLSDRTPGVALSANPNLKHIRTEPGQKDLFVHVVNNQCVPATPPAIHGTFARYFPAGGTDMFEFAYSMFTGQIHLLDFTPGATNPTKSTLWEDLFEYYAVTPPAGQTLAGMVFRTAANTLTNAEPPTDRQINKNAVFPITDFRTNSPIQKGIRLIECQQVDTSTTMGISPWGTPNKAVSTFAPYAGNAIVYPDRIRKDVATKIANAGTRQLRWAKYNTTTSVWELQANVLPKEQTTQDFLASRQVRYIITHEILHSIQLRPTSTNGSHTTTGSGSIMDATIQLTQDKSTSGNATFRIPSQALTSDQQEFRYKN